MSRAYRVLFILLFIVAAGCASKTPRSDDEQERPLPSYDIVAPPEVGPQPDENYQPPEESYVLVLGPGLARSFAYVGLLKELEAKQIRITGIVAEELGALFSAIWATSSMNNLEWQAHKFSRDTLLDFGFIKMNSGPAPGNKLSKFIEESIRVNDLAVTKVPLIVVSSTENGPVFERQGDIHEILRGAVGVPNILASRKVNGTERLSAAFEIPFPAEYANDLGLGKTLCIDVVGRGSNFRPRNAQDRQLSAQMKSVSTVAKEQLKACDEIIHIPTDGIGYLDFDQKAELIFRGKVAVQKWLANKN